MTEALEQENVSPPSSSPEPPSSSQAAPPSSPLVPSTNTNRPRRRPPITPRRFTRFFNPRPSRDSNNRSKSAQALREITFNDANALRNRRPHPYFEESLKLKSRKRRKIAQAHDATVPPQDATPGSSLPLEDADVNVYPPPLSLQKQPEATPSYCRPIRRVKKLHVYPDWRTQVADFWTSESDWHDYNYFVRGEDTPPMPFCSAACNTNSLVALGDAAGGVRIIESAKEEEVTFRKIHVQFTPHSNAIMDMVFSSDDMLLATASGDQTGRIIDVQTRETLSILADGTSSMKQIAFQPGNDKIVATCSRNTVVGIWDLRCQTVKPQISLLVNVETPPAEENKAVYGRKVTSISDSTAIKGKAAALSSTAPSTPISRGNSSVTCISFLSSSRPHHLLTATDSTAQISLWDIRQRQRSARSYNTSIPISTTAPLSVHLKNRHYGISSLALNTDASRLYSVCKDNTIYAYSTSQLVLGAASSAFTPSTSCTAPSRPTNPRNTTSAAPLYGLRHPRLHVSSFYVRAAVRARTPYHAGAELLAVGSGDKCAILFPTDEHMLRTQCPHHHCSRRDYDYDDDKPHAPPWEFSEWASSTLPRDPARLYWGSQGVPEEEAKQYASALAKEKTWRSQVSYDVPIYSAGAALVGAHEREVTGVSWTHSGELLTIGDDYKVCMWHEDERHGLEKPNNRREKEKATPAAELRRRAVQAKQEHEKRRQEAIRNGLDWIDVDDVTHGWADIVREDWDDENGPGRCWDRYRWNGLD